MNQTFSKMVNKERKSSQSEKSANKDKRRWGSSKKTVVINQQKPATPTVVPTKPPGKKLSAGRKFINFILCRNCCKGDDDDGPYSPIPVQPTPAPTKPLLPTINPLPTTPAVVDKQQPIDPLPSVMTPSTDSALNVKLATEIVVSEKNELKQEQPKNEPPVSSVPKPEAPATTQLPLTSATSTKSINVNDEPDTPMVPVTIQTYPVISPSVSPPLSPVIIKKKVHSTAAADNRRRVYVPPAEDDELVNESSDSSSVASADFNYEAHYFQALSEFNKIKKESAVKQQQMKAEWSEIKKELEKTQERESELQQENKKLVAESNQLMTEKEEQQLSHTASLEKAETSYKMASSEIEKLTSKITVLQETLATETSWKESFKTRLEAIKVVSDDAKSKLSKKIQQQGQKIENLEHQLAMAH